jgi:hypothetical protein
MPEYDADANALIMLACSISFGRTLPVRTGNFVDGAERDQDELESPTRTFRGLPKEQLSQIQHTGQQQQLHQCGMGVPIPAEYCHMWRKADSDIPNKLQDIISRKFSKSSKEGKESKGTISYRHEQRRQLLAMPHLSPSFPPNK